MGIARELGDELRLSRITCNLALAEALQGSTDEADRLLSEAEAPFEARRLPLGIDTVAIQLASGVSARCAGDHRRARHVLRRAIALARSLDYGGPVPVLKALLAAAVLETSEPEETRGRSEEAESLVAEGLELVQLSQEAMATSLLHGVGCTLALQRGELRRAVDEGRESYAVARRARNHLIMLWSLPRLVDAFRAVGDHLAVDALTTRLRLSPAAPAWIRAWAGARPVSAPVSDRPDEWVGDLADLDEVVGVR